jgi:hypothetical protein
MDKGSNGVAPSGFQKTLPYNGFVVKLPLGMIRLGIQALKNELKFRVCGEENGRMHDGSNMIALSHGPEMEYTETVPGLDVSLWKGF